MQAGGHRFDSGHLHQPVPLGRHLGRRITETSRSPGASRHRPDGDLLAVMLFVIVNGKCDAAVAARREPSFGSSRKATAAEPLRNVMCRVHPCA